MTAPPVRVLSLVTPASSVAFATATATSWADALERLAGEAVDAVVVDGDAWPAAGAEIAAVTERAVLLIVVADAGAEHAIDWLRRGADDVVGRDELAGASGLRRIRFAIERRRCAASSHAAYSTDPGTGLPHRQQLIEHLSQLLALREREPAPMAVLGLRIDDPAGYGVNGGAAAAAALRRKIAVRLRAVVRAGDVVAAIDEGRFAVLLGSIVAPADAERVAAKLVTTLLAPFSFGASECAIAVALGIAHYPRDGQDAERLLRRALALAAVAPAAAQAGPATARDGRDAERAAANDE